MKVLHVISGDLWAGAEVQAFTLLTTLHADLGIEVIAVLLNEGELARRLRARGVSVSVIPEHELNGIRIALRLRNLIARWQPDVVHTHRFKENILSSIANLLSTNVASVRTAHGANEYAATGVHEKAVRYLDILCGRYLQERIIAVSSDLAEKLANDFPREKIVVIENGIDIEAVRAQVHPISFREDEPQATHIGIVGRLVPVKRVDLFLGVARELLARYPAREWRFHVFGDGPLRGSLVSQSREMRLDAYVRFHGHSDESIACIAGLDVLVSCSDYEGLPMTLLESLAVGTRVVAHAVGGITSLIGSIDDVVGVNKHDARGYAMAIGETLSNLSNARRSPLGGGGRFTARENARRIVSLYQQLTEEHAA